MTGYAHWLSALGRPAVFAHRGASHDAPENSLSALRLAAELGADGVEFDVQRCATGELVVFHDESLARCTGSVGLVRDATLAAIGRLTLDRWDTRRGSRHAGERIPTLEAWLDAAPRSLFLNLEVKCGHVGEAEAAGDCARALEEHGRAHGSVVSSFHPAALAVCGVAMPTLDRGVLVEESGAWRALLFAGVVTGARALHVPKELVTPRRVRAWHAAGFVVATWTVDAAADLDRCMAAGVDAVISNRPDVARRHADQFRR